MLDQAPIEGVLRRYGHQIELELSVQTLCTSIAIVPDSRGECLVTHFEELIDLQRVKGVAIPVSYPCIEVDRLTLHESRVLDALWGSHWRVDLVFQKGDHAHRPLLIF